MRHLLATATVVALLSTTGGAVGAQEASPDPEASPTPEQLTDAEERLATASCLGKPATIVSIDGFEIVGTPGVDVIVGTEGDDIIRGEGGNDRICSGPGADVVEGGAGKDRIDGGLGDDQLDGGTGNDIINGGKGADMVTGAAGNDRLSGAAGDDTLDGGRGNDVCAGGPGHDWLPGCNDKKRTRGTVVVNRNLMLKGPHKGTFIIGKNGVTVDCGGHTVTGPGPEVNTWGVFLQYRKNVTVRNCDVRNFWVGIETQDSNRNTLAHNRVSRVRAGFAIERSDSNRLVANEVIDVLDQYVGTCGFCFAGSDRNRIRDNVAINAGDNAFGVWDSKRNTFTNNTATGGSSRGGFPGQNGFLAHTGAFGNIFEGNTAMNLTAWGIADNTTSGLRGDTEVDNTYADNTCSGNGEGDSSPPGLCE